MNKIYGYARVSTKKQSIERQISNIKDAYPVIDEMKDLYTESFTGTQISRPQFDKLLKRVQPGDTIVFDSVSRMSRNAEEGIELYFELYNKGINLVFLKEAYINTETYKSTLSNQQIEHVGNDIADIYIDATNKVLRMLAEKQIRIAFDQAEKEVTDLQTRTKEALQKKKDRGEKLGHEVGDTYTTKKELEAKEKIRKHSKMFGGNLNDSEMIDYCKISRGTYYRYKKELMHEVA